MNSLYRADRRTTQRQVEADRRRVLRGAYLTTVMRELNKKFIHLSETFAATAQIFTLDFSHPDHVVVSFYTTNSGDTRIPRTLITNQRIYPKRQCWGKLTIHKDSKRTVLVREVRVEQQITVRPDPILQVTIDLGENNPSMVDLDNVFFGSKQETST